MVALSAVLRQPSRFTGLVLTSGAAKVNSAVQPLIDGSKVDYEATLSMFVEACIAVYRMRRVGRNRVIIGM